MFFCWGDLSEIERRVALYKATHAPTPSERIYNQEISSMEVEMYDKINSETQIQMNHWLDSIGMARR